MVVAIEEWMLIAIGGVSFLMFMAGLYLFSKIRQYPDAFVHMKADQQKATICRVHFRGRKCEDYIAEQDKSEKEVGTNYWTVPALGIKFKPGPEDIEFIEGSIPCVNYFENMPQGIKTSEAVAYSQLKDYLTKIGLPIDGMEKDILYILQEIQKKPDERAIQNARIDSTETKEYLKKYLGTLKIKNEELKNLKRDSGVFTYQTAMKALDNCIAYTSANIAHTKEVIRAAIMRSEDNKRKDYITYAIVAFIVALGAAAFVMTVGK